MPHAQARAELKAAQELETKEKEKQTKKGKKQKK
jgi:hypothetical protein